MHPSPFAHNGGLFSLKVFQILFEGSLILLLFQPASSSAYPFLNVWMSASFFSLDVKGKNAKIPKGNCQLPSHLKFSLQFHSKAQVLPVPNTEEGKAYENLSKWNETQLRWCVVKSYMPWHRLRAAKPSGLEMIKIAIQLQAFPPTITSLGSGHSGRRDICDFTINIQ